MIIANICFMRFTLAVRAYINVSGICIAIDFNASVVLFCPCTVAWHRIVDYYVIYYIILSLAVDKRNFLTLNDNHTLYIYYKNLYIFNIINSRVSYSVSYKCYNHTYICTTSSKLLLILLLLSTNQRINMHTQPLPILINKINTINIYYNFFFIWLLSSCSTSWLCIWWLADVLLAKLITTLL